MSRSIWVGMSLHAVCMKSSIRVAAAWWCAMIYWFIVSFSDRMGTTFNGNELEFIHVKKKNAFLQTHGDVFKMKSSPHLLFSFSNILLFLQSHIRFPDLHLSFFSLQTWCEETEPILPWTRASCLRCGMLHWPQLLVRLSNSCSVRDVAYFWF